MTMYLNRLDPERALQSESEFTALVAAGLATPTALDQAVVSGKAMRKLAARRRHEALLRSREHH